MAFCIIIVTLMSDFERSWNFEIIVTFAIGIVNWRNIAPMVTYERMFTHFEFLQYSVPYTIHSARLRQSDPIA
jgi:hypothetical protein